MKLLDLNVFYSYYSNNLCCNILSGLHGDFRYVMCLVSYRGYPLVMKLSIFKRFYDFFLVCVLCSSRY